MASHVAFMMVQCVRSQWHQKPWPLWPLTRHPQLNPPLSPFATCISLDLVFLVSNRLCMLFLLGIFYAGTESQIEFLVTQVILGTYMDWTFHRINSSVSLSFCQQNHTAMLNWLNSDFFLPWWDKYLNFSGLCWHVILNRNCGHATWLRTFKKRKNRNQTMSLICEHSQFIHPATF